MRVRLKSAETSPSEDESQARDTDNSQAQVRNRIKQ